MNDFPIKVKDLLDEFVDIVVDELPRTLPPIRSINYRIELIPRASFSNKETYILTLEENQEVKE
jgi:hypothetical protein